MKAANHVRGVRKLLNVEVELTVCCRVSVVNFQLTARENKQPLHCVSTTAAVQCILLYCFISEEIKFTQILNSRYEISLYNLHSTELDIYLAPLSTPLSLLTSAFFLAIAYIPARSPCSSNTNLLLIPRVHTTFASRGFSIAATSVWNSLHCGIHACSSSHTFRRLLKTHCFDQAFSSPSGSHKCLRFGLWPTLCTLKDFTD